MMQHKIVFAVLLSLHCIMVDFTANCARNAINPVLISKKILLCRYFQELNTYLFYEKKKACTFNTCLITAIQLVHMIKANLQDILVSATITADVYVTLLLPT
jgi:hypothetical protein